MKSDTLSPALLEVIKKQRQDELTTTFEVVVTERATYWSASVVCQREKYLVERGVSVKKELGLKALFGAVSDSMKALMK